MQQQSFGLSFATMPRPRKEARRGQAIGWEGVRGTDVLHSLAYWRGVSRTSAHCRAQYEAQRRIAYTPTLTELSVAEAFVPAKSALARGFDLQGYARQLLGIAA